ncbi:transposase [Nocardia sp. CWNU-33]|uniref:transposase n=1 Tax=Nocardia sp. CWNU-33 TaxID=3392117 RepID=UPI00398F6BD9
MLGQLAEKTSPGLQSVPGIGPVTAAIIICAYSHHGRIRSEAAFAALAGVAPRSASSGNTVRHRLNRQLNRAFDVIVRTWLSFDADTRAYAERSRAQGKSPREIRRNLKRYVCRAVFRQMHAMA